MSPKMEYFLVITIVIAFGFFFVEDYEVRALIMFAFIYNAGKVMKLTEKLEVQEREIEELKDKMKNDDMEI